MKHKNNDAKDLFALVLLVYGVASLFSSIYNFSFMHQSTVLTFLLNPLATLGFFAAVIWVIIFVGTGFFVVSRG